VRIVGGEFRGRTLATPRSSDIRPTADRTRESLFNILSHSYPEALEGTRVLDLFAGTGAVGLEALSRGCRQALFVEQGVEGRGLLRVNIEALGLQGRAKIFRRDATDLGPVGTMEPFHLVFADPPYAKGSEKARSRRPRPADGSFPAPWSCWKSVRTCDCNCPLRSSRSMSAPLATRECTSIDFAPFDLGRTGVAKTADGNGGVDGAGRIDAA
jgi:16S rRNA (guanine966-N2)-methyltransferase